MYVGSVLGSGILVVPAIAANIAGPASLVAWVLLSVLSYPVGYTFGALAANYPEAGGLSVYVRRAFGWAAGTVAGWLFVFSFLVGAPTVAIIAASYIIVTSGLPSALIYLLAAIFMCVTISVNLLGIEIGGRVESILLALVLILLFIAAALTLPSVRVSEFAPFAPHGWFTVGVVAILVFWSFQGYENVPHMAEEFRNPKRDFQLSIAVSVVITSTLYVITSITTIGTGIYKNQSLYAPIASMFSRSLGINANVVTFFLALTTCFGVMHAYAIGCSRLVYALARDHSMPAFLFKLNNRAAPARALLLLLAGSGITLSMIALINPKLDELFLISGAGWISLYVVGAAAAIKLLRLKGPLKAFPYLTFMASAFVLVFAGTYVLFPLFVAAVAAVWVMAKRRSQPENEDSLQ
jgi:amino acid efflux transporter